MKLFCSFKIIFVVFLLGSTVSCDKGRKSFKSFYSEFEPVIKGPITKENFEVAKKARIGFLMIQAAHFDKNSGKDAGKVAAQIRENFVKFGDSLLKETQKCNDESKPLELNVISMSDPILADIRKHKNKPYKLKKNNSVNEGECYASDNEKEFDNKPSYEKIRVVKVEKIGEISVLYKTIFEAKPPQLKSNWLESLQSRKSEEYEKSIFDYSRMKLNCDKINTLVEAYDQYAKVMGPCLDNVDKLNYISELMKSEMKKSN